MKKCDNCGAPFDGGVCPYCGQAAVREHTGASDPASFNTGFQQNTAPVYHTAQQPTAAPYSQPTPAASPKVNGRHSSFACFWDTLGYTGSILVKSGWAYCIYSPMACLVSAGLST